MLCVSDFEDTTYISSLISIIRFDHANRQPNRLILSRTGWDDQVLTEYLVFFALHFLMTVGPVVALPHATGILPMNLAAFVNRHLCPLLFS